MDNWLVAVGWILTLITWLVALKISLGSTKRSELNKSIDTFQSMIRVLEDDALEFWMKSTNAVQEYQLTLQLKRITNAANAIIKIDNKQSFPTKEIAEFRSAITLDIEQKSPSPGALKARSQKIMIWSVKLQDHFNKAA